MGLQILRDKIESSIRVLDSVVRGPLKSQLSEFTGLMPLPVEGAQFQ